MRSNASRAIPLAAAIATLVVHLIGNPHYGFFRDELYFIICGFRPAWGYVDQPPLVPLMSAGSQLFGHSLFLIRAIPAIFAAAAVYTTCLLVEELGGGAFAQIFAAIVVALTPVLMSFGTKMTTDVAGLWLWPLAALLILRIVRGGDPRWWLAVGIIFGAALESKYSALLFAVSVLGGLLLLPTRRVLFNSWFLGGALIAALIALPSFIWQGAHGYPMWTMLHDAGEFQNAILTPLQYVAAQVLITHPLLAPVWIVGVVALLRRTDARFLGIAFLLLIAQMIVLHGKHYYPGDVYPIPIAAGAVAIEGWTARALFWRPVLAMYALVAGIVLVPLLMPVLPEGAMSEYDQIAESKPLEHEVALARIDHRPVGDLPPDWADMHGWEKLARVVAGIYQSLPPDQRAQAAILASNYGEAAAIDFFGARYGLPPVLSGHNQYWIWGTRGYSGNVLIDVHGRCQLDAHLFRVRRVVTHFANPWGRVFENGFPISICEGITTPLATYWPHFRNYI